jgi:hypothetical protein
MRDGVVEKETLIRPKNIPKIISCETKEEVKPMAKYTECRNCGRTMTIISYGLCGGCYQASKPFERGSAEYNEALAEAKKRLTDPNYKNQTKIKHEENKAVIRKSRKTKKSAKPSKNIHENIPQIKPKSKADVLTLLKDRRHELMQEVEKTTIAIQIIENLQAA